jgi:hypothetical protein
LLASQEASKHNTAPPLPAQPGDQPLETGPHHRPARGATEIIVDHLDLAEAPTTRDVDEFVLSPLALEVIWACRP